MGIGLSILIPVYNWDVNGFVAELHKQAIALNIPFEILVYNDASPTSFSTDFEDLSFVVYKYLNKNIGRSRIRNLLAKDAQYSKLLFLDGDSYPKRSDFLSQYWSTKINTETILCGGTAYHNLLDGEDPTLRWVYGKKREENATSKKGFASNNFLIDKETFMTVLFNEDIKGYGHEDTLFGIECKKRKYSFQRCNAPLYHLGLESDKVFIRKTKEGVVNLKKLYLQGKVSKDDSKLIEFHEKLMLGGLIRVGVVLILPLLYIMVKYLYSLKAFDLLKWYWFSGHIRKS